MHDIRGFAPRICIIIVDYKGDPLIWTLILHLILGIIMGSPHNMPTNIGAMRGGSPNKYNIMGLTTGGSPRDMHNNIGLGPLFLVHYLGAPPYNVHYPTGQSP